MSDEDKDQALICRIREYQELKKSTAELTSELSQHLRFFKDAADYLERRLKADNTDLPAGLRTPPLDPGIIELLDKLQSARDRQRELAATLQEPGVHLK